MRFLLVALLAASALSQQWRYERRNIMTIALGIACPTERTCFLGGTQDGVGNIVLVTNNGGESYEEADLGEGGRPPNQMMLMSTASQTATSAVTVGMGFGNNAVFTDNGRAFDKGTEFTLIGVSQNVKTIPGTRLGYGMAGQFVTGSDANIATSLDGGRTWRTFALPDGLLGASSRYIHFVNERTWYVSGGRWPRNDAANGADMHHINEIFSMNTKTGSMIFHGLENLNKTYGAAEREGYVASIVKTTDGGATWERVFYEADRTYYFNQIDCPTENTCFVSGEGRGSARIVKTEDGGRSWRIVWQQASQHNLMGLRFLSATEGWACGMKVGGPDGFQTLFLHTTNAGARWEEHLVGQAMCSDMSFATRVNAHATAIEPLSGQSSTLVYRV